MDQPRKEVLELQEGDTVGDDRENPWYVVTGDPYENSAARIVVPVQYFPDGGLGERVWDDGTTTVPIITYQDGEAS